MIKAVVENPVEIRMGSPFRFGKVRFTGEWQPQIPAPTFIQDLISYSQDGQVLALVQGANNRSNGEIGLAFHILLIDSKTREVLISGLIDGGCEQLAVIEPRKVQCMIWNPGRYPGLTSTIVVDTFTPWKLSE